VSKPREIRLRRLTRDELARVGEIDRTERIDVLYLQHGTRLEERRGQARSQLRDLRTSHSSTSAEARNATIQLELRTEETSGVAVPGSRLDRALDKALDVLAWEAVATLAIVVVLAPFALVAAAVWTTRHVRRRREEERLLAAP